MKDKSNKNHTKRLLHELQQFVLNRKTTDVRNELYEHMITHAIFDHAKSDGTLSYDEISSQIRTDYELGNIPPIHFNKALEGLVSSECLSLVNGRFALSQSVKNKVKKDQKNADDLETYVKNELTKSIRNEILAITDEKIFAILEGFSVLIGTTFAEYGSIAARSFTEGGEYFVDLKNKTKFKEIYQNSLLSHLSKDHQNTLDKIFNEFFLHPTEQISAYLFSTAQSFVYLEILNLDPNLQRLQNIAWSKKNIYLDTNVLLHLLLEGSSLHDTIQTLIEETKQLGAHIIITEKTASEYEKVIERSKKECASFRYRPKYQVIFDEAKKDNQFLASYFQELKKNPRLTVDIFAKKYEEYRILLQNYSISIEESQKSIDLDGDDATRLRVHIVNNALWKNHQVAQHDTYNILRVHELRKSGGDEVGPKAWLLTTDHTLQRAEFDTFGKKIIPANVIPDVWFDIISPFVSPTLAIKDRNIAFTKLLGSNFKSHKMEIDDVAVLLSMWNDKMFTVEQVKLIVGNDYIREKFHEIRENLPEGTSVDLEKFRPILENGLKLIQDDFDKKLSIKETHNQKQLQEMQKNVADLQKIVSVLTKEKTNAQRYSKRIEQKLSIVVTILLSSAILNTLTGLGLNWIQFPLSWNAMILAIMFGIEFGALWFSPKVIEKYRRQKLAGILKDWTRQDKIALASLVVAILSVIITIVITLAVYRPNPTS